MTEEVVRIRCKGIGKVVYLPAPDKWKPVHWSIPDNDWCSWRSSKEDAIVAVIEAQTQNPHRRLAIIKRWFA